MTIQYTQSAGSRSRRNFLRGTAAAAATLAVLDGSRLITGPGTAWALELRSLNEAQGDNLLRLLRDIFPHDFLADVFYVNAIAPLDDAADADPQMRELLADGLADLDRRAREVAGSSADVSFARLSPERVRVAIIETISNTSFFTTVYGTCLIPFYNQREHWPVFGFEGPSSPLGGYIDRGFDDLEWI